jgi:hypothetical protein
MQLLLWRSGRLLGVSFADFLNGSFVIAVNLLCLLSLIREFVNAHCRLVAATKLVSE